MHNKTDCLICGTPLVYEKEEIAADCSLCGSKQLTSVTCQNGHFVCDTCHSKDASALIENVCIKSNETDPYKLSIQLMEHSAFKMHGPEHHFLVPAVLLSTYYNLKGEQYKKEKAIQQARKRAEKVPGGFCGFCGNCGAAVGAGIFMSVVLQANPLSVESWSLCNRMTAQSLNLVADHGGPRCCKRDTFLSIQSAVSFAKGNLEFDFGELSQPVCLFSDLNKECLANACMFYEG